MKMTIENAVRVRTPWHETRRGCWSLSLELGGLTVRVTQRKPGATFERIMVCGGAQDWKSLETTDRVLAESRAREFLRAVVADVGAEPTVEPAAVRPPTVPHTEPTPTVAPPATDSSQPGHPPLPLGRLWTLYERSEAFATLDSHTQAGYRASGRVLVASLGPETDVTLLDDEKVTGHKNRRYAGGITYQRRRHNRFGHVMRDASGADVIVEATTKPARDRTVALDLQLLRVMLYWAVETRGPDGRYLLDQFPIRGRIAIPHERNPVRPFADYPRFCALLQGVQAAATTAEQQRDTRRARRYRLLELALVLVEATGRRIGAVLELRRSDLRLDEASGFAGARIRWRPDGDKKGKEWWVPLPRELAALLAALLKRLSVVGDAYLFAQVRSPDRAVSQNELSQWARALEREAQVPHLPGGLWHPWRRKWSKERKHLPVKDVMAAGGWQDIKTFMMAYNEPDFDTMLDVMEAPARARADAAERASVVSARLGVRRRPASRPAADRDVRRDGSRPGHLRRV
jgi:integrase